MSKDFETSLLTLLGVSLVLWRRKADNAPSNPLFYIYIFINSTKPRVFYNFLLLYM
jgi:hypothetical protein